MDRITLKEDEKVAENIKDKEEGLSKSKNEKYMEAQAEDISK